MTTKLKTHSIYLSFPEFKEYLLNIEFKCGECGKQSTAFWAVEREWNNLISCSKKSKKI